MPRAKRHYLHGYVWHITHRCHKKEFLLKLVKDRQRWLYWLFEAKKRYGLIDFNSIMRLLLIESQDELKEAHHKCIEAELKKSQPDRQSKWTQSIAVGEKSFVEQIKERLGIGSKGRKIIEDDDAYQLRDEQTGYGDRVQFNSENSFYWNLDNKTVGPYIS